MEANFACASGKKNPNGRYVQLWKRQLRDVVNLFHWLFEQNMHWAEDFPPPQQCLGIKSCCIIIKECITSIFFNCPTIRNKRQVNSLLPSKNTKWSPDLSYTILAENAAWKWEKGEHFKLRVYRKMEEVFEGSFRVGLEEHPILGQSWLTRLQVAWDSFLVEALSSFPTKCSRRRK